MKKSGVNLVLKCMNVRKKSDILKRNRMHEIIMRGRKLSKINKYTKYQRNNTKKKT